MSNHANPLRTFVLMLGIMTIAAIVTSSQALAQTPCNCTDVYLKVDPNINCTVNICVKDVTGLNCLAIAPGGGLFPVPCTAKYAFYLQDCNGNYVLVDAANPVSCICMAPGCCVDAFVVLDVNGCWVIKVEPSQLCPIC